jgi:formate hydrogenlyase subunit 3/multisubunit Na+/H+ antiporter MnhD subunit
MAPAGIYLLMRVHPFLGDTPAWSIILPVVGGLTLLIGAALTLRQNELRSQLAHVTVAMLGLSVMLLGTSLRLAILAACATLLAHALSMGALVLAAGSVAERTGASGIDGLRGLARAMPLTCAAIFLAVMTLTGAPYTLGFWAMGLARDALLTENPLALSLFAFLAPSTALIVATAFAVAVTAFFPGGDEMPKSASDGPPGLWLGPIALSFGAIAAAIFGAWTGKYLLDPAHLAIALRLGEVGNPPAIRLDAGFAIAMAIWALGAVICWARWRRRIRTPRWQPHAERAIGYAGAAMIAGVSAWALIRLSTDLSTEPLSAPPTAMTAGNERQSSRLLQGFAILAMIAAPLLALLRPRLRWLFACLVVAGTGSLAAGLTLGSPIGLAGAVVFAIQFPIIIAGLVMTAAAAGLTGNRARSGDGGQFFGASPVLAAATLVFTFALAGMPPFSGFWPRILLAQAALLEARWWLAAAILLSGLLILIAAARTFAGIFDTGRSVEKPFHNLTARSRLFVFAAPIALAALTVLLGVWPAIVISIADRSVAVLLSP